MRIRGRIALSALAASSVFGGALSCSQGAPRSAPSEPMAASVPAYELSEATAAYVTGHWKWSHVSEDSGVRRVELETWQFAPAPPEPSPDDNEAMGAGAVALRGSYTRTIDFLAMDGKPFSCSQDLVYQLRASYTVVGVVRGDSFEIAETGYVTAPSPCERGERQLSRYRGGLIDGGARMSLGWDGGEQTLVRIRAPESARVVAGVMDLAAGGPGGMAQGESVPPSPPPDAEKQPGGVGGAWHWHGRTSVDDELRVELEDWLLEEGPGGAISGSVTRTVTVFDERGTYYPCSGDTFYRYQDRYTVRGERRAGVVQLSEVGVQPDDHPCLPYRERHLDGAWGARSGDYLELTWRGNRRQVLHRPM